MRIQADMTLRTDPGPFRAVWRGDKTAEARKNDRQYQVGDVISLIEFSREHGKWVPPHREIIIRVTHVQRLAEYFLTADNVVVLSFKILQRREHGVRDSKLCRGCRGDRAAS